MLEFGVSLPLRFTTALCACLAVSGCAPNFSLPPGSEWQTNDAVLLSVSEGVPQCGILFTLTEVRLRTNNGKEVSIYLFCSDHDPGALEIGAKCSVRAQSSYAETATTTAGKPIGEEPVLIATEITCDDQRLVFDHVDSI